MKTDKCPTTENVNIHITCTCICVIWFWFSHVYIARKKKLNENWTKTEQTNEWMNEWNGWQNDAWQKKNLWSKNDMCACVYLCPDQVKKNHISHNLKDGNDDRCVCVCVCMSPPHLHSPSSPHHFIHCYNFKQKKNHSASSKWEEVRLLLFVRCRIVSLYVDYKRAQFLYIPHHTTTIKSVFFFRLLFVIEKICRSHHYLFSAYSFVCHGTDT